VPQNRGGIISPTDERYLLPREVAAIFRVKPDTIHAWIRAGRMTAANIGTSGRPSYLVAESEVRRLLGGNGTAPAQDAGPEEQA
jgi:hypothetical protein